MTIKARFDKREDFARECKELGIQRIYLSFEQQASEFEAIPPIKPGDDLTPQKYIHILTIVRLMAVVVNNGLGTLITHPIVADVRDVPKEQITAESTEEMNLAIQNTFIRSISEKFAQPFEFVWGAVGFD